MHLVTRNYCTRNYLGVSETLPESSVLIIEENCHKLEVRICRHHNVNRERLNEELFTE